jgi:hypothetical protein
MASAILLQGVDPNTETLGREAEVAVPRIFTIANIDSSVDGANFDAVAQSARGGLPPLV